MNWEAIREEISRRYAVVVDEGHEMAFTVGERARRMGIRHREEGGLSWIHILAPIASAADVSLERALRLNAELAFGALALDGDQFVFCQSMCLPAVEAASLHRMVRVVALRAGELRSWSGLERGVHPYADTFAG